MLLITLLIKTMNSDNFPINNIRLPTSATLKKYGLSADDYVSIWERQKGECPICERKFDEKVRAVIDHLHVPRYKKMSPDRRKKFVRGLVCIYDNRRMLPKGMTLQKAKNIVLYLQLFRDADILSELALKAEQSSQTTR